MIVIEFHSEDGGSITMASPGAPEPIKLTVADNEDNEVAIELTREEWNQIHSVWDMI